MPHDVSTGGDVVAPPAPAPGSLVGRYVVGERIGAGAMGVVVAAYDPELDRTVALKLLQLADTAEHATGNARLVREAQAMARLSHPNIVRVHDVGVENGRVFVALDLVEGGTLREWLATPRRLSEILDVMLAAGRGLAAAHDAGLVHRDFKPDNVLVDRDRRPYVTDFGLVRVGAPTRRILARPVVPVDTEHDITVHGAIVGTPAYMAPEQFEGGEVDERTDQFAFCVTLYEAVYGARPFQGATVDHLASAVLRGELAVPPVGRRVPGWLRRALVRGLARHPGDRHASMHELLTALRSAPRRIRIAAFTGGAAIACAAAVAVGSWSRREPCVADASERQVVVSDLEGALDRTMTSLAVGEAAALTGRQTLTRWLGRWASVHDAACRATHVTAERSQASLAAVHACMDELVDEARAVIDVAQDADVAAGRLVVALAGLPDPEACRRIVRDVEGAADPEVRAEVARVRATAALGLRPPAGLAVDGVPRRGTRTTLEHALLAAERDDAPRARARGWMARVVGLAASSQPPVELARAARLAHVAIDVAGDDAGWHATVDRAHAQGLLAQQRTSEAIDLLHRAARHQARHLGTTHVALVDTQWALARALRSSGDETRALGVSLGALALAESGYGPEHPIAGAIRVELALALRRGGHVEAAQKQRTRGLAALGVHEVLP